jgi:uncharacterized membrane protein YfcA
VNEPFWIYPFLFLTGLAAGFVDAIAGGGGLLTVPALLACGIPPHVALGTNKLQSTCGTALATWNYTRAGLVRSEGLWIGILSNLVGAALGAAAALRLDPAMLRRLIPFLLLAVAIYAAVKRDLGMTRSPARLSRATFGLCFGLLLGFYDGFFGPGTGSFWMLACVVVLGMELQFAAGYTKVMNLSSNVMALTAFFLGGQIHFPIGILMAVGNVVGARFGSGLVIRRGSGLIRPVFLAVVLALSLKLFWDGYFRNF